MRFGSIKNSVFFAILILGMISILEIGARTYSHFFPIESRDQRRLTYGNDPKLIHISWGDQMQPHPYFGYMRSSVLPQIESLKQQVREDVFVVILTGGSLAEHLEDFSDSDLGRRLQAQIPELKSKKVVFYNFALGGFKQPQQYFLTSYLLENVNLVINLDGYNDVINFPGRRMAPLEFPLFSLKFFEPKSNGLPFLYAAQSVRNLYSLMNQLPFRLETLLSSHAYFYGWRILRRGLYTAFLNIEARYVRAYPEKKETFGEIDSEEETSRFVEIWKKYIQLTSNVTAARDVRFFSFVQPNQYLQGSKPLSAEERKLAFDAAVEQNTIVRVNGLYRGAEELVRAKYPVFNLMKVFEQVQDSLYIDTCCHINAAGSKILSDEMIRIIAENWRKTSTGRTQIRANLTKQIP